MDYRALLSPRTCREHDDAQVTWKTNAQGEGYPVCAVCGVQGPTDRECALHVLRCIYRDSPGLRERVRIVAELVRRDEPDGFRQAVELINSVSREDYEQGISQTHAHCHAEVAAG